MSVVFSDVDTPILNGFSLARLVAMRWPHIPILITSGKVSYGARFLPKPYRPSDLVAEIQSASGRLIALAARAAA